MKCSLPTCDADHTVGGGLVVSAKGKEYALCGAHVAAVRAAAGAGGGLVGQLFGKWLEKKAPWALEIARAWKSAAAPAQDPPVHVDAEVRPVDAA